METNTNTLVKYKYLRKQPMAFTLGEKSEYHLHEGMVVELPSDNAHVISLEAQKIIQKVTNNSKKEK